MVEQHTKARNLPPEWDGLCGDNYALKRTFLAQMERGNPSFQQYFVFRTPAGTIDSILVTFVSRRCNIFMFTPFTFRMNVTYAHVPLSVTRPGYVIGQATKTEVEQVLRNHKGCVIVLNAPPDLKLDGFASGRTCSRINLHLRWSSLEQYIGSMRSHYRYRYRQALQRGADLQYRFLADNRDFDERLYSFYERVHAKSRTKIEKLSIDYFRAPISKILVCEKDGQPLGFIQLIENGRELVFAFTGLDYAHNRTYDTYINLLLKMVEYGIDKGFQVLELGQTAEDAKLKLGGKFTELHALLFHSNPVLHWFIHQIIGLISYKQPDADHRVFVKEDGS